MAFQYISEQTWTGSGGGVPTAGSYTAPDGADLIVIVWHAIDQNIIENPYTAAWGDGNVSTPQTYASPQANFIHFYYGCAYALAADFPSGGTGVISLTRPPSEETQFAWRITAIAFSGIDSFKSSLHTFDQETDGQGSAGRKAMNLSLSPTVEPRDVVIVVSTMTTEDATHAFSQGETTHFAATGSNAEHLIGSKVATADSITVGAENTDQTKGRILTLMALVFRPIIPPNPFLEFTANEFRTLTRDVGGGAELIRASDSRLVRYHSLVPGDLVVTALFNGKQQIEVFDSFPDRVFVFQDGSTFIGDDGQFYVKEED